MNTIVTPPFASPFLHVLNTNHSANTAETEKITALLDLPQQKLHELDTDIAQLEESLHNLRVERDTLRSFIDGHHALLSPFRRLPEDIVREIFIRCLDPYPVRSTKQAPLLLTTICRSWRDIALTTPRLWCSIHIYLPCMNAFSVDETDDLGLQKMQEDYRHLMEQRRAGVELWLKRSGSVPLSFSFSCARGGMVPDDRDMLLQFVLDMFILHRTRWKEVRFGGALGSQSMRSLGALKPEDFPLLEAMEPSRTAWGVDWSPLHIDSLLRAPLLHRLDLSTLGDRFVDLPVRWGQLTELTICPPSFSAFTAVDALTILSFTHRNIRRCSFFVDAPFTIDPPNYVQAFPFAHIHLLALESFALEFRNYAVGNGDDDHTCQDISAFMAVLSCPRLNHLVINAASQTSVMENSPLSQFLARSDCRLISLSTNLAMTTKAVEHTLQHIPSLNTLSAYTALYMIDGFVTWLEALTSMDPKNSELICPSLQHLRVCHVDSAHADSVLRVVRSRLDLPEAARLKSVHASFTRYTGESYRSEVEELRRLGLDIHWGFPRFDSGKVDDSPDDDHPNRSFHPFDWLLPDDRDSMETY